MLHFVYMIRLPDEHADMTVEDYRLGTPTAFQEAWTPFFNGEVDVNTFFGNLIAAMPEWAGDTVSSGGPGFLDAHRTGWTTQYLEPGSYILECYVMDDTGAFHNMSGMLEKLVVTEDVSAAAEPDADLAVSISSTGGIVFEAEDVQPGAYNVSVTFEDNAVYGHGLGHDVHLIRLENGTTVEDVNGWINYLDVAEDGFYADRGALVSTYENPGPETFLGGVQATFANAAAGQSYPITAYMHVNLTPGRYAWVAEVPNPIQPVADNPEMTMLVEFEVAPHTDLAGAWYDPEAAGQGWSFVAAEGGLLGYFYGFGDSGTPLWLITESLIESPGPGEAVTTGLLYSEAGRFDQPAEPADFIYWGELTVTFDNCEEATAEISGLHGAQTQELVRLTTAPGAEGTCQL
ncbi:MAG: hypothetical protein HND55_14990 [Pseudomonadota bacterium]|nr:MAG: hypothetical protein HND55_14990 [Pseudomonadota bacterium]